jgi:hypothetical protein
MSTGAETFDETLIDPSLVTRVDHDSPKRPRPHLHAFHLETEPWLFTINRQRIITARLEGTFGVNEARQALQAALQ